MLASALFMASSAHAAAGLVAAYALNEGSGTTVADASGNRNIGLLSGGVTWTTGEVGQALSFNGTNGLVTIPDSASLDLSSAMTVEAWVYPTSVDGWRDVIYKGSNDIYYLMGSSVNGNAPAFGGNFAGNSVFAASSLSLNTWSFIAGTYDGATQTLYVNGVEVASRAQTGPIQTSTGALTLGGDLGFGQYWAGRIDEVRIYNQALSAGEIQTDMNTGIVPEIPDSVPPMVSISLPVSGGTVSHVAAIAASESDNTGISSVQFFQNGMSIGTDITAPYFANWDTTMVANGSYTLTVVALDLAGNQTTSSPVTVNVFNPVFVNEIVVPGITSATTMAFLPDNRMLVGELTEVIWVVQPGASAPDPTPFLRLDYSLCFGEQGLMDILIDPNFAQNGYYYVFYTHGTAVAE